MALLRRRFLQLAAAAVAVPAAPRIARTQVYPSRPVRVVVPFAAGGPSDVISRIIVQKLPDLWRKQVYIENIPAGASNVGTSAAAKAIADGHTLLVVSG